ncbi:hypothetical protein HYV86_02890 [Candidatus Woesearchaeota archaeon]|nr:hypothetical protein [Candidatus Woesearchaeota archaeon]
MIEETLYVGDMHSNYLGLEAAVAIAQQRGVSERILLGDLTYHMASQYSRETARRGAQLRQQLRSIQDNPLKTAIQNGEYTSQQLEAILQPATAIRGVVEHSQRAAYQHIRQIDPTAITIAGNWDTEESITDVFADHFRPAGMTEEQGIRRLWAPGGGTPPIGHVGFNEGFFSDHADEGIHHMQDVIPYLVQPQGVTDAENTIDEIVTHVPFPKPGQHTDQFSLQLQDALFKRHELGLPAIGNLVHGHHHGGFSYTWETLEDKKSGKTLEVECFAPGVLALEHNDGTHGTFCFARRDTTSHQILEIDEYRVWNGIAGIMKVEFYATHHIDRVNKKVDTHHVGEIVSKRANLQLFKEHMEFDPNSRLRDRGLVTDYTHLSAFETDLALRQSIAVIGEYVEDARHAVKTAFDTMYHEHLTQMDAGHRLTGRDETIALQKVRDNLAIWASKLLKIDYDAIYTDAIERDYFKSIAVQAVLGVTLDTLRQHVPMRGKTVGDINGHSAKELEKEVGNTMWGKHIQPLIKNIEPSQFAEMVDKVYAPQSVQRKAGLDPEVDRSTFVNLWAKGWQQGLLSKDDLLASGFYIANNNFHEHKMPDAELRNLTGMVTEPHSSPQPIYVPEREIPAIQEKISQNRASVFRNNLGDYILTKEGPLYIPESQRSSMQYEPVTMKGLVEQGARLVTGGDQYFVEVNNKLRPIDLAAENIDPSQYNVTPRYQVEIEQQQHRTQQQEELRRLFQSQGENPDTRSLLPPQPTVESNSLGSPSLPYTPPTL